MTEKKKLFLTDLAVGTAVTAALAIWDPQGAGAAVHRLCNGAFVAAVLLLGLGGLTFVRNRGVFDMMGYSLRSVFDITFPGAGIGRVREEREDFVAYAQRKAEKRKSAAPALWAGLVYLALSLALLGAYYIA